MPVCMDSEPFYLKNSKDSDVSLPLLVMLLPNRNKTTPLTSENSLHSSGPSQRNFVSISLVSHLQSTLITTHCLTCMWWQQFRCSTSCHRILESSSRLNISTRLRMPCPSYWNLRNRDPCCQRNQRWWVSTQVELRNSGLHASLFTLVGRTTHTCSQTSGQWLYLTPLTRVREAHNLDSANKGEEVKQMSYDSSFQDRAWWNSSIKIDIFQH